MRQDSIQLRTWGVENWTLSNITNQEQGFYSRVYVSLVRRYLVGIGSPESSTPQIEANKPHVFVYITNHKKYRYSHLLEKSKLTKYEN